MMLMTTTSLLMPITGAFIYRMRGGMPPRLPSPIDQILFSLPYGCVAFAAQGWVAGLIVLAITTIAVRKGHGDDMDLGLMPDNEPEWYDIFVGWRRKLPSAYWRDVIGLAASGLSYTIPAGIVTMNPFLALSGALKAPCYMLAKRAEHSVDFAIPAELLTGAILWSAIL